MCAEEVGGGVDVRIVGEHKSVGVAGRGWVQEAWLHSWEMWVVVGRMRGRRHWRWSLTRPPVADGDSAVPVSHAPPTLVSANREGKKVKRL